MPGISLAYRFSGPLPDTTAALASLAYFPSYIRQTLIDSDTRLLASVRYSDYPVTTFEQGAWQVVMDGRIYDKPEPQVRAELLKLAERLFEPDGRDALVRWLLGTDGEFVITLYNRVTHQLALFNDALGRLSLYYHANSQELLISRDIRFVASLMQNRRFDRMALAQYLLLGFPFAQRTLFEDVELLPPASLIRVSPQGVQREQVHVFNFDHQAHRNQSIQQNAEALTELIYTAARHRSDDQHSNVLSLSGGRDSRTIGAVLRNLNIPFTTATMLDYYKTAQGDADLAGEAAKLLGAQWNLMELGPTFGKLALQLLTIKSGLCGLRLCDILPFFEGIQQRAAGPVYYLTGDGGAKLSDQRPARHVSDVDDLVNFVASRHQRASVNTAAEVTGIPRGDILDEMRARFNSYPEKDMAHKHVHFMIYERAPRFGYESEDRNRCYFWSQSPLYALPFVQYIMNCSNEQKANYALYSAFMSHISPEAANLTEENVGLPITSQRYRLKHGVKRMLMGAVSRSPALVRVAKNFIGRTNPYESDHRILKCLRDQLHNSPSVAEYLSVPAVEKMLANPQSYSKEEMQLLLTIGSAIEAYEEPVPTLTRYADQHVI